MSDIVNETATAGGTSSGSVASSMGGGNGFVGGIGVIKRAPGSKKKKATKKKA